MFIEEAIYARLSALVEGRVFPGVAPEGAAFPYITFSIVSDDVGVTFGGPDGSEPTQVQIDCWAKIHVTALQTAKAVFDEVFRDDGPDFGCSGAQRLPDERENGVFGIRREFTLELLE